LDLEGPVVQPDPSRAIFDRDWMDFSRLVEPNALVKEQALVKKTLDYPLAA
jgi:hypothetical protein